MKLKELLEREIEIKKDGTINLIKENKERWKPEYRKDHYYFVNDGGEIYGRDWTNCEYDNYKYKQKNCFETETEAKEYRKYLEAVENYRDKSDYLEMIDKYKWELVAHIENKKENIKYVSTGTNIYSGVMFESIEKAKEFVKEVGEKNVLKFMFEIDK